MIWFVLLLLVGLVTAFVLQPFFSREFSLSDDRLAKARAQRATIGLDRAEGRLAEDAAAQARDALDRRILEILNESERGSPLRNLRTAAIFLVPAILILGVASVYVRIGSPAYERITVAEFRASQVANLPQSLDGLVIELRNRLEADPNPPADGFVLLARSYVRLGNVDGALEAYERAIELSNNDPQFSAERDRLIAALQNRDAAPAIDPEAAARIQAMTPDEQAEMIEAMVDGLAVRLEQNPDDADGWGRLIRARLVLGQRDQAALDLQRAQEIFAQEPETLAQFEAFRSELSDTE